VREISKTNLGTRVEFPVSPLPFSFLFLSWTGKNQDDSGAPLRTSAVMVVELNDGIGAVEILQRDSWIGSSKNKIMERSN
jgi:hypothetical protein